MSPPPPGAETAHIPQVAHQYPMISHYSQGYFPQTEGQFPQQQFNPEFMNAYMQQMHMAPATFGAAQFMAHHAAPPAEPVVETKSVSLLNDSGNHTITPEPSNAEQPRTDSSTHTSPHFPPAPTGGPAMTPLQQMHQMVLTPTPLQQSAPVNSAYAINSLLGSDAPSSTKSSPTCKVEEAEEQENKAKRRNTAPATTGSSRKRRPTDCPTPIRPTPTLPIHPNILPGYPYPVMMNNFSAFVDPFRNARELCTICGDSSTGYHYGVLSCEGCKGFFRRSVQKQMRYTCMKKEQCTFSYENCSVNRAERTRCQACRYARCVEMGMNKDCVRKGVEKDQKPTLPPNKRRRSTTPQEDLPAEIEELVDSFAHSMSIGSDLVSTVQLLNATKTLIREVEALNARFPMDDQQLEMETHKMFAGLATIRAAFSLDPVAFFKSDQAVIAKLREGLRNTVLMNEGVALLSAIYILNFTNEDAGELKETYRRGLRHYFDRTRTQTPGTWDRLVTKITRLF